MSKIIYGVKRRRKFDNLPKYREHSKNEDFIASTKTGIIPKYTCYISDVEKNSNSTQKIVNQTIVTGSRECIDNKVLKDFSESNAAQHIGYGSIYDSELYMFRNKGITQYNAHDERPKYINKRNVSLTDISNNEINTDLSQVEFILSDYHEHQFSDDTSVQKQYSTSNNSISQNSTSNSISSFINMQKNSPKLNTEHLSSSCKDADKTVNNYFKRNGNVSCINKDSLLLSNGMDYLSHELYNQTYNRLYPYSDYSKSLSIPKISQYRNNKIDNIAREPKFRNYDLNCFNSLYFKHSSSKRKIISPKHRHNIAINKNNSLHEMLSVENKNELLCPAPSETLMDNPKLLKHKLKSNSSNLECFNLKTLQHDYLLLSTDNLNTPSNIGLHMLSAGDQMNKNCRVIGKDKNGLYKAKKYSGNLFVPTYNEYKRNCALNIKTEYRSTKINNYPFPMSKSEKYETVQLFTSENCKIHDETNNNKETISNSKNNGKYLRHEIKKCNESEITSNNITSMAKDNIFQAVMLVKHVSEQYNSSSIDTQNNESENNIKKTLVESGGTTEVMQDNGHLNNLKDRQFDVNNICILNAQYRKDSVEARCPIELSNKLIPEPYMKNTVENYNKIDTEQQYLSSNVNVDKQIICAPKSSQTNKSRVYGNIVSNDRAASGLTKKYSDVHENVEKLPVELNKVGNGSNFICDDTRRDSNNIVKSNIKYEPLDCHLIIKAKNTDNSIQEKDTCSKDQQIREIEQIISTENLSHDTANSAENESRVTLTSNILSDKIPVLYEIHNDWNNDIIAYENQPISSKATLLDSKFNLNQDELAKQEKYAPNNHLEFKKIRDNGPTVDIVIINESQFSEKSTDNTLNTAFCASVMGKNEVKNSDIKCTRVKETTNVNFEIAPQNEQTECLQKFICVYEQPNVVLLESYRNGLNDYNDLNEHVCENFSSNNEHDKEIVYKNVVSIDETFKNNKNALQSENNKPTNLTSLKLSELSGPNNIMKPIDLKSINEVNSKKLTNPDTKQKEYDFNFREYCNGLNINVKKKSKSHAFHDPIDIKPVNTDSLIPLSNSPLQSTNLENKTSKLSIVPIAKLPQGYDKPNIETTFIDGNNSDEYDAKENIINIFASCEANFLDTKNDYALHEKNVPVEEKMHRKIFLNTVNDNKPVLSIFTLENEQISVNAKFLDHENVKEFDSNLPINEFYDYKFIANNNCNSINSSADKKQNYESGEFKNLLNTKQNSGISVILPLTDDSVTYAAKSFTNNGNNASNSNTVIPRRDESFKHQQNAFESEFIDNSDASIALQLVNKSVKPEINDKLDFIETQINEPIIVPIYNKRNEVMYSEQIVGHDETKTGLNENEPFQNNSHRKRSNALMKDQQKKEYNVKICNDIHEGLSEQRNNNSNFTKLTKNRLFTEKVTGNDEKTIHYNQINTSMSNQFSENKNDQPVDFNQNNIENKQKDDERADRRSSAAELNYLATSVDRQLNEVSLDVISIQKDILIMYNLANLSKNLKNSKLKLFFLQTHELEKNYHQSILSDEVITRSNKKNNNKEPHNQFKTESIDQDS